MARQFNGTNQSLQSASTIDLSSFNKLTLAYWVWADGTGTQQIIETSAESDTNPGALGIGVFTELRFQCVGNVGISFKLFGSIGTGAWHHHAVTMDFTQAPSDELTNFYLDGNVQSNTGGSGSENTGNFGNFTLNVASRNNTTNWMAGRFAEIAIWGGTILSGSQITELQTKTPDQVGSPTFGWHVAGTASPEPPFAGGVNLTVNGATFVDHPAALTFAQRIPSSRTLFCLKRQVWG